MAEEIAVGIAGGGGGAVEEGGEGGAGDLDLVDRKVVHW